MQSLNRYIPDAANLLRAEGLADITAATFDMPVTKFVEDEAYWQVGQNTIKNGDYDVPVSVTKIADAGTTLQFAVIVCESASKTNPKVHATFEAPHVGQIVVEMNEFAMKKEYPNATHWYLQAQAANATPANIAYNFSAFISPDVD